MRSGCSWFLLCGRQWLYRMPTREGMQVLRADESLGSSAEAFYVVSLVLLPRARRVTQYPSWAALGLSGPTPSHAFLAGARSLIPFLCRRVLRVRLLRS